MAIKKLTISLLIALAAVLSVGIVALAFERWLGARGDGAAAACPIPEDDRLGRTVHGVTLATIPSQVKLEPEHRVRFRVRISNAGDAKVSAWALDLGKRLYLIEASPKELLYHKGHPKGAHGNVLIYANPIAPGGSLEIALTLRVLFDSEGRLDPSPGLRLSYAGSAKDAQALAIQDLQSFRDSFVAFPSAEATIDIER